MDNDLLQAMRQIMKEELKPVNGRLDVLSADMTEVKQDVLDIKQDVAVLKEDVAVLKEDVAVLKQDVLKINVTLENRIIPHIELLAEGYAGLVEKQQGFEALAERVEDIQDTVSVLKCITVTNRAGIR